MYAGNQYLTINSSLSASNLIDVSPSLTIPVGEKSSLKFYNRWYWRYSAHDGIYGPGMTGLSPSYQNGARIRRYATIGRIPLAHQQEPRGLLFGRLFFSLPGHEGFRPKGVNRITC
ncbi:hypothetical protein HP546_17945 [Pseudomonas sp. CM25]|nr:hypothetical protein [Pseudomonas sp. CM25]